MKLNLELWHFLLLLGGFLTLVLGCAKLWAVQYEKRLEDNLRAIRESLEELSKRMDERLESQRELRQEGNAAWENRCQQHMALVVARHQGALDDMERIRVALSRLDNQIDGLSAYMAEHYVNKEAWMEQVGNLSGKLDAIARRSQ